MATRVYLLAVCKLMYTFEEFQVKLPEIHSLLVLSSSPLSLPHSPSTPTIMQDGEDLDVVVNATQKVANCTSQVLRAVYSGSYETMETYCAAFIDQCNNVSA